MNVAKVVLCCSLSEGVPCGAVGSLCSALRVVVREASTEKRER